jgi:hypothetical protein
MKEEEDHTYKNEVECHNKERTTSATTPRSKVADAAADNVSEDGIMYGVTEE